MTVRRDDTLVSGAPNYWSALAVRSRFCVTTAAGFLQLSPRQFERRCRRELGCSPHEFFHRERMMRAEQLLTRGHAAKHVAAELGYTQPANFTRAFKLHFGKPPSAAISRELHTWESLSRTSWRKMISNVAK